LRRRALGTGDAGAVTGGVSGAGCCPTDASPEEPGISCVFTDAEASEQAVKGEMASASVMTLDFVDSSGSEPTATVTGSDSLGLLPVPIHSAFLISSSSDLAHSIPSAQSFSASCPAAGSPASSRS
jgi:hypothetical protein